MTNTLSLVVTPVAVHVAIAVVLAVIEPTVTVQVPKRICVMPEPTAPILMPALEVVVPTTPSATYGELEAMPSAPVEVKVEVAVAPKYAFWKTDN